MATADTSQVVVRYMPEVTWGTIPSTALKELRLTGESLKLDKQLTQSEEIRSDRQITDVITTKVEPMGGTNHELSYAALDDFIEAALYGTWTVTNYSSTSISVSSNVITLPGGHGQTFYVGQKIKMAGWSTSANNGVFTITAVATNTLTTTGLTDDAGGESVTITSRVLRNSTTRKSFVIEKEFNDITKFLVYTGMVISSMSMSIQAQNKITASFNFLGETSQTGTSTVGTGAPTAASTNDIMNAGDHVGSMLENGSAIAMVKGLTIDLNNNLRGKPAVGVVGNAEIGSGRCAITGDVSMYFENFTIYDKYINSTSSSMRITLSDSNGSYDIYFPKIKYTKGEIVAGGPDQDVMVDAGYQALRDPTTGITVMITRV